VNRKLSSQGGNSHMVLVFAKEPAMCNISKGTHSGSITAWNRCKPCLLYKWIWRSS